jgi:hypothetical protein
VISGDGIDQRKLREQLSREGSSLVVAGSQRKVRVHLHTNDPEHVFRLGWRGRAGEGLVSIPGGPRNRPAAGSGGPRRGTLLRPFQTITVRAVIPILVGIETSPKSLLFSTI